MARSMKFASVEREISGIAPWWPGWTPKLAIRLSFERLRFPVRLPKLYGGVSSVPVRIHVKVVAGLLLVNSCILGRVSAWKKLRIVSLIEKRF